MSAVPARSTFSQCLTGFVSGSSVDSIHRTPLAPGARNSTLSRPENRLTCQFLGTATEKPIGSRCSRQPLGTVLAGRGVAVGVASGVEVASGGVAGVGAVIGAVASARLSPVSTGAPGSRRTSHAPIPTVTTSAGTPARSASRPALARRAGSAPVSVGCSRPGQEPGGGGSEPYACCPTCPTCPTCAYGGCSWCA